MSDEQAIETEVHELTLDDLFQEGVDDNEAVKKAERELLLPVGTYVTTPPFTVKLQKTPIKPEDRRLFPGLSSELNTRTVARMWGTVEMGDVKGKIGYALSSTRRNGTVWIDNVDTGDDSGKPDSLYKNYIQAKKAFQVAYGSASTNFKEVVEFLRDYPHKLRIIQTGRGENMVVAISAVRPPA